MDFSIERLDFRPVRDPSLHITATGEIRPGDTDKLMETIDGADTTDVRDVLFMFDSPGGSVMESLRMGAYIADIPAIVSAQVGSAEMKDAICASACVYTFISADYRYISDGGRIGIHRFASTDSDIDGNEGMAVGQSLSGILSEYIRTHRAEPELFEAISSIDHEDILWVSRRDLEDWRVVTNNIYDEQAHYINLNGDIALRMKQAAISGDSWLTLFCTEDGISGLADLSEPPTTSYGVFELSVGERWFPVQTWEIVDRSDYRGRVLFNMPPVVADAAIQESSIGARVVLPAGGIFFGFQGALQNDLVSEMIRNCTGPVGPATSSSRSMIEYPGMDFPGGDLTTDGIRDVTFSQCKSICMQSPQCHAVSYVRSRSWCWPKAGVAATNAASGIISAYKE